VFAADFTEAARREAMAFLDRTGKRISLVEV